MIHATVQGETMGRRALLGAFGLVALGASRRPTNDGPLFRSYQQYADASRGMLAAADRLDSAGRDDYPAADCRFIAAGEDAESARRLFVRAIMDAAGMAKLVTPTRFAIATGSPVVSVAEGRRLFVLVLIPPDFESDWFPDFDADPAAFVRPLMLDPSAAF